MKLKESLFAMMLVLSSFLVACGGEGEKTTDEEVTADIEEDIVESTESLNLFTTIYPLEDFANKIGGEFVHVTNLVPIGADAHTFEPTAKQMIEVVEGDAFIYNGAGLEGFVDAIIDTVEGENLKIVKASEGIDLIDFGSDEHDEHAHEEEAAHAHEEEGHEEEAAHAHEEEGHEDEHGHEHEEEAHEESVHEDEQEHNHDEDPHVWLDPVRSIKLAENIKDTLVELMPEQEAYFTTNFDQVKAELEAIDAEFKEMSEAANKDSFLVSHAGYGYWEARYDVHQIGIAGLSPTNEPSQRQLQDIIQLAKEKELNHILFEQNITPKVAEIVKNEVEAEVLYLHNLEALSKEDVENGEDYFSLMKKNIESLRTALQ
ncbi:metal ABC transporter solute-binding protein, Zn/Mn family [Halalkalibacter urbisdiaboli]|uniref:metal ABC transporter solute-binding protein, Zn/Mn family n=1 Tax=Halalkalibacter urbisdiaboli TaxID=1960589 RepID=UPI000B44D65D|nr:zinc ABC transporter substrate-binding protein [Halalkalibacter urbisdiaboli]